MKVKILMNSQSNGVEFENVENAYTKGDMYCVYLKEENIVYKYPLCNIWNVKEEYTHARDKNKTGEEDV